MSSAKQEMQSLLNRLPDDSSYEDIQYHLYVLEKVKHGEKRIQEEGAISHEKAKERLNKWLS